jgi:hypothetical protein
MRYAIESVRATLTTRQLIWSTHSNSESSSSNTLSRLREQLLPLGSQPPAITAIRPARIHPAAKQGGQPSLAQASPLRPELRRHSSGVPCLRVMALLRAPKYLTGYRTLCLPTHLYVFLLTAINVIKIYMVVSPSTSIDVPQKFC